jgi:hypothetical protein
VVVFVSEFHKCSFQGDWVFDHRSGVAPVW